MPEKPKRSWKFVVLCKTYTILTSSKKGLIKLKPIAYRRFNYRRLENSFVLMT